MIGVVDLNVTCSPETAAEAVERFVASGLSVKTVDRYDVPAGDGRRAIVVVFEKYFMRNSSRASLTVTLDNLCGATRVHAVGSGGGQNALFGFDWGAGGDFEESVADALSDYTV